MTDRTTPGLAPEQSDTLARALCDWWDGEGGDEGHAGEERPCRHCRMEIDAITPALAHLLTDARAEAWDEGHRTPWSVTSEPGLGADGYTHTSHPATNPYRKGRP